MFMEPPLNISIDDKCVLFVIYPLRASYTHATTPYGIGTNHIYQLRKNNTVTFTSNESTKLRIPTPKDKKWTVKYRNATQPVDMLILPETTTSETNNPQSTEQCWIH